MGHYGTLWGAGVGAVKSPVLKVSRFQKLPYQSKKILIMDAPAQDSYENCVVYVVEERLNIALYKPPCSAKVAL